MCTPVIGNLVILHASNYVHPSHYVQASKPLGEARKGYFNIITHYLNTITNYLYIKQIVNTSSNYVFWCSVPMAFLRQKHKITSNVHAIIISNYVYIIINYFFSR